MRVALLAELKKLKHSRYWLPAAIIAIGVIGFTIVALLLATHSVGQSDKAICQKKTNAVMRQVIQDVKDGTDKANEDTSTIPECSKLTPEQRTQIARNALAKYSKQWSDAIKQTIEEQTSTESP